MFNKRLSGGYLRIDHRESPGIEGSPFHAKGMFFEADTRNCSHCSRMVILRPDRIRSRAWCPKCDKYICDQCEAERVRTGVCKPFKQVIDEFVDNAAKGLIAGGS